MRIAPCLLGLVALAAAAASHAQSQTPAPPRSLTPDQMRQMMEDREYWRQQRDRYEQIYLRTFDLAPQRRDSPLRELNVTDNEIREIEAIARKFLPRAMVNISPVVTDCPCEEGPTCTAQVYVVAQTREKTRGLQLSRMNDRWGVGMVQQWFLRRDALVPSNTGNPFLDRYLDDKAIYELYEEFPMCSSGKMVPTPKTAATKQAEGKK